MAKILLVDDEKDIIEFLQYNLEAEGFEVISACNGIEALSKLSENPDLIVLDIMMPKLDGYETCKRIRSSKNHKHTPIIFLTAKSSEIDEIHGLNIGADDYIQKPISPKKLIARIKSNLRKTEISEKDKIGENEINIGPLKINKDEYTVFVDNKKVVLPRKEFELLAYLASNPGKVFDREKILSDIWGNDIIVVERTIDVHIRKIREKLGKHADLIETIKGVGYRFKNI
ncbi:MAG: response regulator transcription factor [Melioribacter sp.]|uniref:response regulator transcription factor n=1 Tax=Rosettibacter primus TaxID=3111523 RepID=UPI00247C06D5|nr:response regulator transcription factor [Melioribacter sp.]